LVATIADNKAKSPMALAVVSFLKAKDLAALLLVADFIKDLAVLFLVAMPSFGATIANKAKSPMALAAVALLLVVLRAIMDKSPTFLAISPLLTTLAVSTSTIAVGALPPTFLVATMPALLATIGVLAKSPTAIGNKSPTFHAVSLPLTTLVVFKSTMAIVALPPLMVLLGTTAIGDLSPTFLKISPLVMLLARKMAVGALSPAVMALTAPTVLKINHLSVSIVLIAAILVWVKSLTVLVMPQWAAAVMSQLTVTPAHKALPLTKSALLKSLTAPTLLKIYHLLVTIVLIAAILVWAKSLTVLVMPHWAAAVMSLLTVTPAHKALPLTKSALKFLLTAPSLVVV
jgi:hypothetical protein